MCRLRAWVLHRHSHAISHTPYMRFVQLANCHFFVEVLVFILHISTVFSKTSHCSFAPRAIALQSETKNGRLVEQIGHIKFLILAQVTDAIHE